MGSLEGHGAWLPASSTSTLGAHSCPEKPAGLRHTRGRGAAPRTSPSPCKLAQEESLQDQNAFSLTILLKSLYLEKTNKKTKHSPPNTPPAQTPGNLTVILRKNRAANHERQDPCRVCQGELQGCGVQGQSWVRSDTALNSMVGRESYLSPGRLVSCGF